MKLLWLAPALLAIDQLSKWIVMWNMDLYQSIPVLGDFFRLTYIHNPGAAFGLNLGRPWLHTLSSIVALAALGWLFWTAPRQDRLMNFSLTLVLGGALGNIVDRLRLGEVVDFFDFGIGALRWPIFNFADSFVSVGIGLLALAYWRHDRQRPSGREPRSRSPEEQLAEGG